jgi:hypothetical protein
MPQTVRSSQWRADDQERNQHLARIADALERIADDAEGQRYLTTGAGAPPSEAEADYFLKETTMYEYGVMIRNVEGLHRGPWTKDEAETWIAEALEDGFKPGYFYVVRRPVGNWEETL